MSRKSSFFIIFIFFIAFNKIICSVSNFSVSKRARMIRDLVPLPTTKAITLTLTLLTLLGEKTVLAVSNSNQTSSSSSSSGSITLSPNPNQIKDAKNIEDAQSQKLMIDIENLYFTVKKMRGIYITLGSIITPCGLVLNTLCILVFFKSKLFRNSSFPYYVYVISVVDTLNILIRFAIPQFIEERYRQGILRKFNLSSEEISQDR